MATERVVELHDWIMNVDPTGQFYDHNNYDIWKDTLCELGHQYGMDLRNAFGSSRRTAELVRAGCPPDQIKAIFTLLFL